MIFAVPPWPETACACAADVDLEKPTPLPVAAADCAHAGALAAIETMAAKKSRFMSSSPCARAGRIKIHTRPPTEPRRRKKLFLLAHGTQCSGELFDRKFILNFNN